MTTPAGPLPPIYDAVQARLDALRAGHGTLPAAAPVIPDHVRAAIHAGHIAQVVIFCDRCGVEHEGDYIGETRDDRFAAARHHLATREGWTITPGLDLCPKEAS